MKDKYFNNWKFRQAFAMRNSNPIQCRKNMEQYLQQYPEDHSAYPYYASILITLGHFEEAENILNAVEELVNNSKYLIQDQQKSEHMTYNILFNRLRLLSYQEKYEELYQLYLNNYHRLKSINNLLIYCQNKLGIKPLEEINEDSYMHRQIINYSEHEFIDHIKKHLADYNKNFDNPNNYVFAPDFPIMEVFEEIKKYIPSNITLYHGFCENTYVFKYDQCGKVGSRTVNYFKVICFHNSQNFISMFPSDECETLPYIDLNHMIHSSEKDKVKKISQIEKFNQKYKRQ